MVAESGNSGCYVFFFFFQAEDGIRDHCVTGVQTCALPILLADVETSAKLALVSTPSSRVSSDTPSQVVPSLDQWVTQWMSTVIGSLGSARKAFQSQRCWSPVSLVMVNSQSSRSMVGVGPADRTGKSSTRYWPGGSSTLGRRRPLNPRDTVPISLTPSAPGPCSLAGQEHHPRPEGDRRSARSRITLGAARTSVPSCPLVPDLAEGEGVGLDTWVEEGDLEGVVADGAGLADELVQPRFGGRAVALVVHVGAVGGARRLPVDEHVEPHGGPSCCRSHGQVQVAGVEAVDDPPLGLVEHDGLWLHRPVACQGPMVKGQSCGAA